MQPSSLASYLFLTLRGIPHWIVENLLPLFPLNLFSDLEKKKFWKEDDPVFQSE